MLAILLIALLVFGLIIYSALCMSGQLEDFERADREKWLKEWKQEER